MQAKPTIFILFLVSYCFWITGCSPRYYSPNRHHVPLLTKKGETSIQAAFGSGEDVKGAIDLQGAVAVTNKIAAMINYYNAWGSEEGYGSGSGKLIELGGGYFKPINKFMVFETFAGAGVGSVINFYGQQRTFYSKLNFNRIFVQPAIGFYTNKKYDVRFDGALSLRANRLKFTAFELGNLDAPNIDYDLGDVSKLKENPTYMLIEPALTLRGGYKSLKFHMQMGLSINLSQHELPHEFYNFNLGLALNIIPKNKEE